MTRAEIMLLTAKQTYSMRALIIDELRRNESLAAVVAGRLCKELSMSDLLNTSGEAYCSIPSKVLSPRSVTRISSELLRSNEECIAVLQMLARAVEILLPIAEAQPEIKDHESFSRVVRKPAAISSITMARVLKGKAWLLGSWCTAVSFDVCVRTAFAS